MTRRNCLYPGLALTTLAALCLALPWGMKNDNAGRTAEREKSWAGSRFRNSQN
jgi:hypothetical protein